MTTNDQPRDHLAAIFTRQRELMRLYHPVEKANGLLQTSEVPVDLDDPLGQARLKDLAWRFTEELSEAIDAYLNESGWGAVHEELGDALHFLTELTITADGRPSQLVAHRDEGDALKALYELANRDRAAYERSATTCALGRVITALGLAMNHLRNRPWSQRSRPTNQHQFYQALNNTWLRYLQLAYSLNLTAEGLADRYLRKSETNLRRLDQGH